MSRYFIKTKNGNVFDVSEETANTLSNALTQDREKRPQFVKLSELDVVLNVDSIASIELSKKW